MGKEQKKEEKNQDAILVEILTIKLQEISKSLKSDEASFEFWKQKLARRRMELQAVNTLIDKYSGFPF